MKALIALAALAAASDPVPFERRLESDLLTFVYAWPAEVEAEPALRAGLRAQMEAALRQAQATAAEDRDARRGQDFPFNAHAYERRWTVAGLTPRLLSLATESSAYSGGAHGSVETAALLWDRVADVELRPLDLLGPAAAARIEAAYCTALDAMRGERRGGSIEPDPTDSFTACPSLREQVIAPRDRDGNGRFETLLVLLAPYVAGPWVEGSYLVEVPLAPADLGGLGGAYRDSFEAASAAGPPGERG